MFFIEILNFSPKSHRMIGYFEDESQAIVNILNLLNLALLII